MCVCKLAQICLERILKRAYTSFAFSKELILVIIDQRSQGSVRNMQS